MAEISSTGDQMLVVLECVNRRVKKGPSRGLKRVH